MKLKGVERGGMDLERGLRFSRCFLVDVGRSVGDTFFLVLLRDLVVAVVVCLDGRCFTVGRVPPLEPFSCLGFGLECLPLEVRSDLSRFVLLFVSTFVSPR